MTTQMTTQTVTQAVTLDWDQTGGIVRLCVDRPHARNALDPATMRALAEAIEGLHQAPKLKAVVIHGGGGRFISGGDLRALHALQDGERGAQMAVMMRDTLAALERLPVPVIAAVDGYAIGGGAEVALAADLRVLAHDAFIAFKHIEFGLTPGWGGARRLRDLVGASRARRLFWTAARVEAGSALALGLADRIAPAGQTALEAAVVLAQSIASRPAGAVRSIKRLLPAERPERSAHEALERALFAENWGAPVHWDLVDTFWQGRAAARMKTVGSDS